MANTTIQIKRSTSTDTPPNGSLSSGELAYSYSSNIAYIGTSDGAGVIAVGGKYWLDTINAAFTAANNAQSAGMDYPYVNTATQAANTYAAAVGVAANSYADTVGTSANAYAAAVGVAANSYADTVGTSANAYASAVGVAANTYADDTFLPLSGGTITGDLSVTGNLNISGNTSYINVETYVVNDSLLYLAANNDVADLVDIGFFANYVNATAQSVHTAFYREHEDGEYYLIVGYDQEPANNHIGPVGTNNSTLAYLNANIKAQYISIGGTDALTLISNASNASNSYASAVGVAANTYADAVGVAANTYAAAVGVAANTYAAGVGVAANTYADGVGVAANTYADSVGAAANTNASNASYLSTGTVPTGVISGSYTGISGVGTLSSGTWNADTITVPYGGTGITTAANNGVIFGNTAGPFRVTSAGTEGQVLQANADGTPLFGDIDGGLF